MSSGLAEALTCSRKTALSMVALAGGTRDRIAQSCSRSRHPAGVEHEVGIAGAVKVGTLSIAQASPLAGISTLKVSAPGAADSPLAGSSNASGMPSRTSTRCHAEPEMSELLGHLVLSLVKQLLVLCLRAEGFHTHAQHSGQNAAFVAGSGEKNASESHQGAVCWASAAIDKQFTRRGFVLCFSKNDRNPLPRFPQ